jgi:hypothetical protein
LVSAALIGIELIAVRCINEWNRSNFVTLLAYTYKIGFRLQTLWVSFVQTSKICHDV